LSHGRRETSLFPALLYESGLKPSLATTYAKASRRVIADPVGQGRLPETRVEVTWRLDKYTDECSCSGVLAI